MATPKAPNGQNGDLLSSRHWLFLGVFSAAVVVRIALYHTQPQTDSSLLHNLKKLAEGAVSPPTLLFGLLSLIVVDELLERFYGTPKRVREEVEDAESVSSEVTEGGTLRLEEEKAEAEFSADKLIQILDGLVKSREDMPVETYVEMCKEITKLFDLLGSALGFAFSSVRKYIAFLEECQKELPPPQPEGSTWTIQKVVEREIQSGAVEQGDKKNPTAARCFLRLMWLIDFVQALAKNIVEMDAELPKCASMAYDETLSKYHPWIIRKGVATALGSCPSKQKFLSKIVARDESGNVGEEQTIKGLTEVYLKMKIVEDTLWEFYKKHNIEELK